MFSPLYLNPSDAPKVLDPREQNWISILDDIIVMLFDILNKPEIRKED